jgi:hypothetical protein
LDHDRVAYASGNRYLETDAWWSRSLGFTYVFLLEIESGFRPENSPHGAGYFRRTDVVMVV